jgi:hypothetical protein
MLKKYAEKIQGLALIQNIKELGKIVRTNKLKFNYQKENSVNLAFDTGNKTFIFSARVMPRISQEVQGISARTDYGKYCIFWDFDEHTGLSEEEICDELQFLQKEHSLPDIYVFRSSTNSYHAICCAVMPLISAYAIIRSSSCDSAFQNAFRYQGKTWILRFSHKGEKSAPIYLKTLRHKSSKFVQSEAHLRFLSQYYKIPISFQTIKMDGCKKIPMVQYLTGSRLKKLK